MICALHNGDWCAYYINGECVADDMWGAYRCIEPQVVPIWVDTWKVIGLLDMSEMKAQVDVAEMVIKSANPDDPHNRLNVLGCKQAVEGCIDFLEIKKRFDRGIFSKGDDIFTAVNGESELAEEKKVVSQGLTLPIKVGSAPNNMDKEVKGEWI